MKLEVEIEEGTGGGAVEEANNPEESAAENQAIHPIQPEAKPSLARGFLERGSIGREQLLDVGQAERDDKHYHHQFDHGGVFGAEIGRASCRERV